MFTTPPLHNYHSKPAKSSPRLPILLFNIYLLFIYPYGVMKTGMCGLVASDASFIFACYWGINVAELRFNWLGNPKSLIGHKMVPVPLCSPHISHRMGRDWTRDPPRQESDNYRPEVWRVSLSHCSRPMQICLRSHCSCVQPLCLKYLQK